MLRVVINGLTYEEDKLFWGFWHRHHRHRRRLNLTVSGDVAVQMKEGHMSVSMGIDNTQKFLLSIAPVDASGAPVTLPTQATWDENSGGSVVTLQPAADGNSCEVLSVDGATGTATVTVHAAGAGEGGSDLSDFCSVSVTVAPAPTPTPAVAADLGLSAGPAEAK